MVFVIKIPRRKHRLANNMELISPHDNFAFFSQDVFAEGDKFECHFGGNSVGKQILLGVWLIDLILFLCSLALK